MKSIHYVRPIFVIGFIVVLACVIVSSAVSQENPGEQNGDEKSADKPTEKNVTARITRQVMPLVMDGVPSPPLTVETHELYTIWYDLPSVNQRFRVTFAPNPGSLQPGIGQFELAEDMRAAVSVFEGSFFAHIEDINPGPNRTGGPMICPLVALVNIDVSDCGTNYTGFNSSEKDDEGKPKFSYLFLLEGEFVTAHTAGKPEQHKETLTTADIDKQCLKSDKDGPIVRLEIDSEDGLRKKYNLLVLANDFIE